jgi:hypothetical protein
MKKGHAVRTPENGLYYVAMTSDVPAISGIMNPLKLQKPWVFQLNVFTAERAWAPYYPFILSIADKDHLWAFIRGEVYILVIIEEGRLCQIAKEKGYEATIDTNNDQSVLTVEIGPDAKAGVSSHFLGRIGLEFLSPEWVVITAIAMLLSGAPKKHSAHS